MDQSAPHCDWLLYRNWVLTAISCLAGTYPMLQSYVEGIHYPFPMHWGDSIVQRLEDQREDPYPLDVFGLAQLTLWMLEMAIAFYPPLKIPARFSVHPLYMEKDCYTIGIQKGLARADALRICPYRLWNLAVSSKYGDFDLASLVNLVDKSVHRNCFRQANHDDCTGESCQMADNNSTVLEQLHVCHNHACRTSNFPFPRCSTNLLIVRSGVSAIRLIICRDCMKAMATQLFLTCGQTVPVWVLADLALSIPASSDTLTRS